MSKNIFKLKFLLALAAFAMIAGATSGAYAQGTAASKTLDFNGDGKTDYSVFRLTNNTWYINIAGTTNFYGVPFGDSSTDFLTPGDYDGDGKTDISVWRSTTGVYYTLKSSTNTVATLYFGQNGDQPVDRDYNGDGKTDHAVVRRTGGALIWYIANSGTTTTFTGTQFGLDTDVTVPGDYDGDGKFDLAVYRGMPGQPATFYVLQSTGGIKSVQFGMGGDVVVPGDYDGDGKTDFAIVRQGTPYTWYYLRSSTNNTSLNGVQFGQKPFYTTQGDYDGDGKTDISAYDPTEGIFYVFRSSLGTTASFNFGRNGDYPIANLDTH